MTHHAKAMSAGSIQGSGASRNPFRRALATRGASSDAAGSGAPANGSLRATLVALAFFSLAFVLNAAPADASNARIGAVSNVSYASAHVDGEVDADGFAFYTFEYSSDALLWSPGQGPGTSGFLTEGKNKKVEADFEGLRGGTKYYVRISVDFGAVIAPAAPPYPSFTTLAVDPPVVVSADNASNVFSRSATASGKVKRPSNSDAAFNVSCRFEYVTDAQFTATGFAGASVRPCEQPALTAPNAEATVSATVGCPNWATEASEGKCLEPETTYHLRLVAENAAPGSVSKEAASTFTTTAPVADPVVLAADDAADVSYYTAKASGEIQRPVGADPALNTVCRFEYVTDEQFTSNGFADAGQASCAETPPETPLASTDPAKVSAEVTGLADDTTYHLRLVAENGGGTASKVAAGTFTTLESTPPSIAIQPISPADTGYGTAHVTATVDPGIPAQGILFYWEISTDPTEGWEQTFCCYVEPGKSDYANDFADLKPGTEYFVRVLAYGSEGEFTPSAPYESFVTKGTSAPPTVSLDSVPPPTATSAQFSGTVDANAPDEVLPADATEAYRTKWRFECTPECPDGPGFSGTVEADQGPVVVSVDAAYLEPNSGYEVTLIASNDLGTVEAPVRTFQTPAIAPTVTAFPGGSDGKGGYALEGSVDPNNATVTDCRFEYGTTATYPNTYKANCSPLPTGVNEVQRVLLKGGIGIGTISVSEGQFKLTYRGQTTGDLPYDATAAEVESELEALSTVGANNVSVVRQLLKEQAPGIDLLAYDVTFEGTFAETNVPPLKGKHGTIPLGSRPDLGGGPGQATIGVTTSIQGGNNRAKAVQAHLEGLTSGVVYHFKMFATNAAGTTETSDRSFIPMLDPKEPICPNETVRAENSSLALPECRAYEMVSAPGKEGFPASLRAVRGDTVMFAATPGSIAGSGQGTIGDSTYLTQRTASGWEVVPNLSGPGGSPYSPPGNGKNYTESSIFYSVDLMSAIWKLNRTGTPAGDTAELRGPDGNFTLLGTGSPMGGGGLNAGAGPTLIDASDDLSHSIWGYDGLYQTVWGPGIYEWVGTGNGDPRRVDVDNAGNPPACGLGVQDADGYSISGDGRVIAFGVNVGCGEPAPTIGLRARIGGSTTIDISASKCDRGPGDPGGVCNSLSSADYQGMTSDGSRVFFTTKQQLVDEDVDQTNDLYACDIPANVPAPAGATNPCPALTQISSAASGADVLGDPPSRELAKMRVGGGVRFTEDGSTVIFTAKGVLATNQDALGATAQVGDRNLYVWRSNASPADRTRFVARLDDFGTQLSPDGRFLVIDTITPLLESDTDESRDVYRYDAETGETTRISTGRSGAGGNGEGLDATGASISDDGQKIVFTTKEPLAPVDGNQALDVYLWTPARVSLITTGSVEGAASGGAGISGSGRDIYFHTAGALSPADPDVSSDVYDARIGGGFSFAPENGCSGESCQPPAPAPPEQRRSASEVPSSSSPVPPKACRKGQVRKKGKCVKKSKKKKGHKAKKHVRHGSGGAK